MASKFGIWWQKSWLRSWSEKIRSELGEWWQKIQHHPFIMMGIIVLLIVFVAFVLAIYWFGWDWTGFSGYSPPTPQYQRGKTLWDWLQLLFIPAMIAFGGLWFTTQQGKVSARENTDNQREAALQGYLDKMSELLLNGNLAEQTADGQLNPEYKRVCLVARVRTITVLAQLDARRIGYVFAFLREAELMSVTKDDSAISLNNADLHAVDWSQADLRGADLRGANLSGANLSGAIFFSIIYVPRAFGGTIVIPNCADLSRANLSGANLSGAKVTDEQLAKAASLKGATMPDGKIRS